MGWWFSADQERDELMTDRFSGLLEECAAGHLYRCWKRFLRLASRRACCESELVCNCTEARTHPVLDKTFL